MNADADTIATVTTSCTTSQRGNVMRWWMGNNVAADHFARKPPLRLLLRMPRCSGCCRSVPSVLLILGKGEVMVRRAELQLPGVAIYRLTISKNVRYYRHEKL